MKICTKIKQATVFVLTLLLLSTMFSIVPIRVSALSGAGTEASPYIVNTAQDLNSIRNNLSAHYKLGNTIDASSLGTFQPIGTLARPFTGSFTCDTDAAGKPLYAIKNLKVYNDAGEKNGHEIGKSASYSDYSEKNSKWEAGLFGATDGATLKGIYILDADITNTVLGQHQMNSDFTHNPGMDEQNAAILVGDALNTYIIGCGVTGKITSKTNHVGGLIGRASGSVVENSFAKTTINGSGLWCHGGLIGSCDATQISFCMAEVQLQSAATETAGLLIGSFGSGSSASDTYVGGTSNIGKDFIGRYEDTLSTVTNCYTTGTVKSPAEPEKESQQYSVTDGYSTMTADYGFKKATAAEIAGIFGSKKGWKTENGKAVIAGMAYITDAAQFTVGAGTVAPSTPGVTDPQPGDTTSGSAQSGTANVEELISMIEALPDGESVTLEDKEEIKEAKIAFDALDDAAFNEMPNEAIAKLNAAVDALSLLMVADIAQSVKKLPEVDKLTAENKETVLSLWEDYNFLSEEYQMAISQKLRDKLDAAYKAVSEMKDAVSVVTRPLTTAEIVVCIVLIVLIAGVLALNVWLCIYIFKKNRQKKLSQLDISSSSASAE